MAHSGSPICGSCGNTPANTTDAGTPTCDNGNCGDCTTACNGNDSACDGASPCEEDHSTSTTIDSYATTIKVTAPFNFPAVGEAVSLSLNKVSTLIPGAVLWNESIGYLHVQSYDAATGIAIAQNKGDAGNKDAGTRIPGCTEFIVGILSTSVGFTNNNSDIVPYLAADFTAPGNGNCQLASVTNVNGITLNDIISISGFKYRVADIPDANTIQLCDEGEGAPIGQVIEHDAECGGVPSVQVVVLSSDNPCARDAVNGGVLVVCDEGTRKPFVGTIDGQLAVWNHVAGLWQLINANIIEECTALTINATFDVGDVGPYVIEVVSTNLFTAGQGIIIDPGTPEEIYATVVDVINATQLRITLDTAPGSILNYDSPTQVCIRNCCIDFPALSVEVDDQGDRITVIENDITAIEDEIHAPCYPSQILQVYDPVDWRIENNAFVPRDTGGLVYDKYYDQADPYLPADPINATLGPFSCDVVVQIHVTADMSLATVGDSTMYVNGIGQHHDFMLSVNGDLSSQTPRQLAYNKASDIAGDHDENRLFDDDGSAPPLNFRLLSNINARTLTNMHFHKTEAVAAGVPITIELAQRLSIDGKVQIIDWVGANNHFEFSLTGQVSVLIFRA